MAKSIYNIVKDIEKCSREELNILARHYNVKRRQLSWKKFIDEIAIKIYKVHYLS